MAQFKPNPKSKTATKFKPIEWQAPEYEFYKKTPDWFWSIGIIAFGLFLSAIFLKNFLFAILALVAGFSLALYGAKKPNIISFSADEKGIRVRKRIYPYESLDSFCVHYDPPHKKELTIKSKKTFVPIINLPLGDADSEKTRDLLSRFIKEEAIEESPVSIIMRMIKF